MPTLWCTQLFLQRIHSFLCSTTQTHSWQANSYGSGKACRHHTHKANTHSHLICLLAQLIQLCIPHKAMCRFLEIVFLYHSWVSVSTQCMIMQPRGKKTTFTTLSFVVVLDTVVSMKTSQLQSKPLPTLPLGQFGTTSGIQQFACTRYLLSSLVALAPAVHDSLVPILFTGIDYIWGPWEPVAAACPNTASTMQVAWIATVPKLPWLTLQNLWDAGMQREWNWYHGYEKDHSNAGYFVSGQLLTL